MDSDIHELCLELYRKYLLIGGMPEAQQKYIEEKKLSHVLIYKLK